MGFFNASEPSYPLGGRARRWGSYLSDLTGGNVNWIMCFRNGLVGLVGRHLRALGGGARIGFQICECRTDGGERRRDEERERDEIQHVAAEAVADRQAGVLG